MKTLREVRDKAEREAVEAALAAEGGCIARAAKSLDISRPTLYDLMARLNIPRRRQPIDPGTETAEEDHEQASRHL